MAVKPIPEGHHSVTPYLVVENPAGLIEFLEQAFGAGASSVTEPADQFYGDRGGVTDPAGNTWWIATHIEDVPHDELLRRAQAMGKQ